LLSNFAFDFNLRRYAKLTPVLSMLGKKHLAYGVMPEHYDVVGQAGSSLRTKP
jgi:hemoglobin-like flavoprotein